MYRSYFNNKVIWITGASSGIGEALAYLLAKQKTKLILSSRREKELEKVKKECERLGSQASILIVDLEKSDELVDKTNQAIKIYGNIDFFFNNGGISQRSYIEETPIEVYRKIMEIDFFSGVIITKALLPGMLENGFGHIVSISSLSGCFGFPLRSGYAAAKHAMYGFYETLHAELSYRNIYSTIVAPGRINTDISLNAITYNGSKYGKLDQGQANGISAEKLAHKTLKAVSKKKVELIVGGYETIMLYMRRIIPSLFFKIVKKVSPT